MNFCSQPHVPQPLSLDEFLDAAIPVIVGQGDTAATFERAFTQAFADIFRRLVYKRSLRLDDLFECHAALAPETASGIRSREIHCGGAGRASAVYLPPPVKTLGGYMKDLLFFIKEDGQRLNGWYVPSLVAAAQLALVHPFLEGNGRSARALFALVACRHSGCDREIVTAMQKLWAHESLLIEAVCSRVIASGWQLEMLIDLY